MRLQRWSALGVLATLVLAVSAASGQSTAAKSYVVVMADLPAVAYDGRTAGLPATKPDKGKKINPKSANVRKYQEHLQADHQASRVAAGAGAATVTNEYTIALNGYSAILTEEQAAAITTQKDVVRVLDDELHQPTTDSSPAYLGLTAPGGAYLTGYDGRGVVVGVIDTGIWPEHPSFNPAGFPAPPIPPLDDSVGDPCEFGNTAHSLDDVDFTCNNKLVGARQMLDTYRTVIGAESGDFDSARDHDGHGTHTSSTAAGNANVAASVLGISRGRISGIAPRAHVIMYKGLGLQGGFTSDLVSAIDQAVADGVDVINYSIGGGASLTGGDDIAFLFAADAGVFVASSAGNSGSGPGTIGGPASVPWLTSVGANTQRRSFQGTVVLGNGSRYTGVSITPSLGSKQLVDAAAAGGDLCVPGTLNVAMVTGKIVLCRRGVVGRVEKSRAVDLAGGVGMIMYENSNAGDLMSDTHFVPTVHVDNTPGLAIKSYIGSAANPTASLQGNQAGTTPWAPSMTFFSSRGPNTVAPDIIKPDVTAPGIQILAGASPFAGDTFVQEELFQAIAGTSMSSPHVAGLYALLKQAHPDWSQAAAKSALMTTASSDVLDNDRSTQATPFGQGAGHVTPGRPNQKGSAFQPGLVYDAGFLEYLGFLCDAGPEAFANPAATCALLDSLGIPIEATDLNLASIGVSQVAGTATVKRTVTSVAQESGNRTYTVSVNAPPGYTASVSPSSFTLTTGQSATYEVTFTNVSAPIGAWKFGSLTWTDQTGNYKATSPIALRASKFSAPTDVTGTGVSGTTSFDVQFGYTGAYEARAQGLVQATETNDNVVQDPDQSFDPNDGFSDAHVFALSDVSVFRVAIPPEAAEANADLDVYVFNPGGQLVAQSTLGGTDEEVTIQAPANGNWTVYVHGWQAPGGDSNYTLFSWQVPNATGGSLVATGPSSATLGAVATINLSWTGANGWNLGAVAHMEGGTILGRTLVEVDNRP